MATYLTNTTDLTSVADAIREKGGTSSALVFPDGYVDAIDAIQTGITPSGNIELTQQSGTNVTQYATASVQDGSVTLNTPTVNANGLVTASASVGTSGWVDTAPSDATLQLSTQAATAITPTESSQTAVTSGKYTTGAVTVNAISSTYVGSGISRRTSSNMTVSGATVTAPSGYYSSSASKSVSTTTHPSPTASINSSTGVVTASHTQGTGYVTGGTTTGTLSLTTQAAQTITPTTSDQTIASGKYLTGTQTISGDANLVAGNIKKDVSIFGVTGTYEGSGGGKGGDYNIVQTIDGDNCSLAITDANTFVVGTKSITANGTYTASDDNYDGYSQVTVDVTQGVPIEVSTDAGMTAVLTSANVGKCYKFTGTTGTYTNGDLYVVEAS